MWCGVQAFMEVGVRVWNCFVGLFVLLNMNQAHRYGEAQDEAIVTGFEIPTSPDVSYNNVHPGNEDDAREPPMVPQQLHTTVLNHPSVTRDQSAELPSPQHVVLNHLYLEDRQAQGPVVAVGVTSRFRSKFVTVVLYKPAERRGGSTSNA
ncbi:SNF1-related protein kinase regulatory subunit beta-3 isoform X1 [Solanum lycopersicum]|uniref:Association with the SNF1 complex (ASC) domain-containing protein n=2 Tax=Solanum subgen. Lycopersicon TaxID=49274 RepID=A0A6N2BCK8_SOLCI|nr:hypothetical protein EJD97_013076 [Solanum chilense]